MRERARGVAAAWASWSTPSRSSPRHRMLDWEVFPELGWCRFSLNRAPQPNTKSLWLSPSVFLSLLHGSLALESPGWVKITGWVSLMRWPSHWRSLNLKINGSWPHSQLPQTSPSALTAGVPIENPGAHTGKEDPDKLPPIWFYLPKSPIKGIRDLVLSRLVVRSRQGGMSVGPYGHADNREARLAALNILRLLPVRKPWMGEDYRMSILDAVALRIALFHFNKNTRGV